MPTAARINATSANSPSKSIFHRCSATLSDRACSIVCILMIGRSGSRSEEHTSELQSRRDLVCRLLLEKKKKLYGVLFRWWHAWSVAQLVGRCVDATWN